jgi:hypothetical protein
MSKQLGTSESVGINISTAWQNYGASIVFVVLLPLLPVILEWIIVGSLAEESLLITASIYAAAIAIVSNNRITFGIGLAIAIIEAALYGYVYGSTAANDTRSVIVAKTSTLAVLITSEKSPLLRFASQALWVILVLIVLSVLERFIRHVQNREEFFEFMKKGGTKP